MVDIWKGTQNAIRERFGEPQSTALVGLWWATYLINNFFAYISSFVTRESDSIEGWMSATIIESISEIISIVAIIITLRIILRVSSFEKELAMLALTPEDSIFSDNYTPTAETPNPNTEN
jgi:hypothetical protein